jgi:hypothetical protein
LQSLNKRQYKRYMARVEAAGNKGGSQEYEKIARSIMEKGGVKSMSVTQISETSKLIKEKMDVELKSILSSFELSADFFLTSHSLRKLWAVCFQAEQYRVPLDTFIQAFDATIQRDILGSQEDECLHRQRRDLVKWVFKAYVGEG